MLADTFPAMLRRAAHRWPERTFLRWSDRQRTMTFAAVDELSDRAAGALHGLGVVAGDRVGLLAHNGLDYIVAMFGAWKLGAISAHISVQVAAELTEYANDCTPSVLIYTHDLHDAVDRDRASTPSISTYICMDGPKPGAAGWTELLGPPTPQRRTTARCQKGTIPATSRTRQGRPDDRRVPCSATGRRHERAPASPNGSGSAAPMPHSAQHRRPARTA